MPFKHDSSGIESNSTVLLMPDGWYTMKIDEAEEMKSQNGNNMILVKCSPVNEAQYTEMSIWHYVVFLPKGQKGDGISVWFRKAIGIPVGGNDVVDADDWVGRKFKAYVSQDTYKGKTRNKIIKVDTLEFIPQDEEAEVPF